MYICLKINSDYFHFYVWIDSLFLNVIFKCHSYSSIVCGKSCSHRVASFASFCANGETEAPQWRKISYPAYNCCSNPIWEDRLRTTTRQERYCHIVFLFFCNNKKEYFSVKIRYFCLKTIILNGSIGTLNWEYSYCS